MRERQKRNLVATLMFSEGVPMIFGGDELSHTKNGNNNTYCQDNHLTWPSWDLDPTKQSFLNFVRRCSQIWREQPALQRRKFFLGRAIRGSDVKDISWFGPDGKEMNDEAWQNDHVRCIGMRIAGDLLNETDERGVPIVGDTLLLLLNAHWEEIQFTLPSTSDSQLWETLVDTKDPETELRSFEGGAKFPLFGRSVALLRTSPVTEVGQELSHHQVDMLRREAQRARQAAPMDPPLVR
jgi:glycogen operon protein